LKIIKAKFGTDLFPEQLRELEESLDPALQTFQRKNDVNTPSKKTAIGIDLGTTYSCVALYHAGEVEVLRDEHGKFTIPSYVALIDGVEVIGQEAKAQAYLHPQDTVYDAKRMLAKDFADPCLQADMKHWSFEVVDQDGSARIKLKHGTQLLPPERISSKILSTLKKLAEKYLKTEVQDAVITVPAYFKDGQRNATKDAGELAGLNVLSIINEPTAAALAYFWENIHEGPVNVLVYDLGGGTFDVSVLAMENGVVEVLAVGGDGHLGGEDFDNNVIEYCVQEFKKKTGLDLMAEKMSPDLAKREKHRSIMRRLKNIVEDAKISLAFTPSKNILLEAIHTSHDLNVPLTREMFNFLNQKALDKTLRIVKQTLKESGLKKEQIDEVVLIGGSSRIIKVKEMLGEYFERDLTHSVNPDEAVAVGAAIQAAILNGNKEQRLQNISLEDVTPLSLGIGYRADIYSVIIPKNTKVPVSQSETYHKTPLQRSIYIPVYEGEERKASDNHYLGTYSISDLPITEEDLEIQVTLSISKENILSVSATGEGISKKFVVKRKGRMSTEEKRKYLQEDLVTQHLLFNA
jgi:L1 cell adhesion molecule like protein